MEAIRLELCGGAPALEAAVVRAAELAGAPLKSCVVSRVYLLDRNPGAEAVERLLAAIADPVVEQASWAAVGPGGTGLSGDGPEPGLSDAGRIGAGRIEAGRIEAGIVEVGRLPGVTDAEARELEALAERLGLGPLEAASVMSYRFDPPPPPEVLDRLAPAVLANPIVDRWALGPLPPAFGGATADPDDVTQVPLAGLDDEALAELSRARLLSLDVVEMRAIQRHFEEAGRAPTDGELETLAQTWSEHCLHKTFRARIDFTHRTAEGEVVAQRSIDGLLASHLRAATEAADRPWVRSAFVDNAGIIAFEEPVAGAGTGFDLAIKVETHNHPSALEPFGGANTGVGGVVRDVIGVSARPIACLDVLCFAPATTPAEAVPEGVLHPRRVAEGVVAGIGDYGNKLGLPTVAGAVVYHPGYLGNPLVYCGAVGLLPHGSHPSRPQPGDLVVVVGGRTGRDGIHGATFSSADLSTTTGTTAASAVQIGDPITEKQVLELVEEARDRELYSAITDCGAGGLSSAVGELASSVGVEVDLAVVPRKYPGLLPWEVWLSESQERMVLAVPPAAWPELVERAARWSVEATAIGRLTGDHRLHVCHGSVDVVDLPMAFLHDGCPRRHLVAEWTDPPGTEAGPGAAPAAGRLDDLVLGLLADPTVASKEAIVRTYDHEVRGGSLVRPWCGPGGDGPSDGSVCVPLGHWEGGRAFALAVGINPRYGRLDPYRMAVSAVDEAFRNLVAVGADPDRVALLDNFCWGNPTLPDRLGGLVRASEGCHDAAVAYRAPFVSGKDSLFNEFEGEPIPGTLLITGLGLLTHRDHALSSAPTAPGQVVWLLGETRRELGGSLTGEHLGREGGGVPGPVDAPLDRYRAVHRAIAAGLVVAAHDPSEGGLAVALAELCLAGRSGLNVDVPAVDVPAVDVPAVEVPADGAPDRLDALEWLGSESNGRLLLVASPANAAALTDALAGLPLQRLGTTTAADRLFVRYQGSVVVDLDLDELVAAWHGAPRRPGGSP